MLCSLNLFVVERASSFLYEEMIFGVAGRANKSMV